MKQTIKKKWIIAGAAVISAIVLAVIIVNAFNSPIVGRWVGWVGEPSMFTVTYEFRRGGEGLWHDGRLDGRANQMPIRWRTSGNILEITFEGSIEPLVYGFEIVDGTQLVLTNDNWPEGSDWILTRLEN